MPKLKQSEAKRRQERIRKNIEQLQNEHDVSDPAIYDAAPFSRATFYNRKKRPDDLRIRELAFIAKALNVSIVDLLKGIQ